MATHSVFLPKKPHGHRSLVGYSPKGHKESEMTEQLSTFYIISVYIYPIPISQFTPPLFPPGNCRFDFYSFCFVNKFICIIFWDSTHKQEHMTSLCMTMCRSVHVATHGIISFLLRLSKIPSYICTTSSLSPHLSVVIDVASMSWLL